MWDTRSLRYRDGEIETPGGGSPLGSSRIILLIHGYNNDKEEAEQSYAALALNLSPEYPEIRDQIWKFFWPSYVERLTGTSVDRSLSLSSRYSTTETESNTLLSIPSYAVQVLKAPDVGRALGLYLHDLMRRDNVPTEIVIVAHSLGCRVALEALREMLEVSDLITERQRVPCVCLMAAAVPTFMIAEGARLGDAATMPQTSYVLHSRADLVLRVGFPAGQGAASVLVRTGAGASEVDEGWFPEAVGRYGNPPNVWLRRADTGLGHSEYWDHPSTAPSLLRALGKRSTRELSRLPTLEGVKWVLPANPDLPDWRNRDRKQSRELTRRTLLG